MKTRLAFETWAAMIAEAPECAKVHRRAAWDEAHGWRVSLAIVAGKRTISMLALTPVQALKLASFHEEAAARASEEDRPFYLALARDLANLATSTEAANAHGLTPWSRENPITAPYPDRRDTCEPLKLTTSC